MLVRLSRAPVVSIASIRGRATGVGSELALACDMRFASREKAILSHFEVGAGMVPGGGPMARLPRLMGRGRALEVLLGADDFPGDLAERYGYVNRSLPDADLDAFVESLATRIASFDKRAISETKRFVDVASLPPDYEIAPEWDVCLASIMRPAAQERIKKLMEQGFHQPGDVENRLGYHVGQLRALREDHPIMEPKGKGMAFENFTVEDIATRAATIHTLRRGAGPPLLLLHGYPQTHFIWHKIADRLSEQYTVVLTDLRGYGDSSKPEGGARHENYSFRAMAQDQVEVMRHLGHKTFFVASHDRGARTAHRMCLDHPQAVRKVCFMDIAPTLRMYRDTSKEFATKYMWWFFLIQKAPLPEHMIACRRRFLP